MKEIRSKHKQLKEWKVPQGACTDGKHIYVVYERKKPHSCKIAKYDLEGKLIKVSGRLKIGHGNDVCYRNGILYITHSSGEMVIHRVDAKTLKQKKGFKVVVPKKYSKKGIEAFNGIATYGKGFILRVMHGRGMAIIKKKRGKDGKMHYYIVKFYRTDTMYKTSQGMTTKDMVVFRSYSHAQKGTNYIVRYSSKGKEISRKRAKNKHGNLKGELEGIFFLGDRLYATTYLKEGKERLTYLTELEPFQ